MRSKMGRGFGLPGSVAAAAAFVVGQAAATSSFDDGFSDGAAGPQWSIIADSPIELSLAETGGQLQVLAASPALATTDALYLSNGPEGFTLATDADFRITLDYSFVGFDAGNASVGDLLGVTFGVGRDLDGTDSAAIGFAVSRQLVGPFAIDGTALGEAHRIDDVQTENILNLLGPTSGTFDITYDASGDDLTLGVDSFTFTLEDTVRTVWDADDLFVSFGARGNGFSLNPGDAALDNFTIVEGHVLPACTPGDYNGDGVVGQDDFNLVLLNWGDSSGFPPPGWIKGFPGEPNPGELTPIIGQDELNAVLLNWGAGFSPTARAVPEPTAAATLILIGSAWLRRR
ncbi:MAG: hypothetical protein AAF333_08130 [Planctomycetota bacterium]